MSKKTGIKKSQTNDNQQKAIKHKFGPLLVVAGAGTGKTRVITERIKHLIERRKENPNQILALTFTEKASQEMLNRIGDVMPLGYEEPWIYTFHSFADRILKEEGLEIGIDSAYKIIPDPEQWLLLRKNIFNLDLKYFRTLGNPTKFISAILKFISRLQDENISPQEFDSYIKRHKFEKDEKNRWEELSYTYQQYTQLKLQESKMDFGDLITWTVKLFKERPHILKKYQEQFKYILVDEFQDTNYAQYELIKLLCPVKMGSRSLLVVGDDSQSIYKFRGAAVSNIIQFMGDYPNAEMVTLIQNFRSTQKILDPAYKLIQNNNPDTLESKLGISKKLEAEKSKKGPTPKIIFVDSLENEVEYVISTILDVLGKEPEYTYRDFAILARANNHLDPFVMALRKYGLPYQLVGNKGLYDRAEIVDLSSLIKTIINPKDGPSLFMSLNIPTLNIPYKDAVQVFSTSRFERTDTWEVLKNSANDNVTTFVEIVEDFQENITRESPSKFVYDLVASTNFLNQFLDEDTIENQLCIKNLNLFLKKIQKFEVDFYNESKRMPTIIDFVDYLDLMREAGENPAQAEIEDIDTINLMTVHASKGLEFPIVFMVNLVSDRFPTRNRGDEIEVPDDLIKETLPTGDGHIQEERRLFYVGMTRAQKYLYLTSAKNYGGKRDKTPSGFLEETGIESVEVSPESITTKKLQGSLFGVETSFRDPTAQKIETLIPATLSYSQVEKFRICPLQYKYAYILRIPTPPNHTLSFGDTIHKTLRDFHYSKMFNNTVELEELVSMYEKNWQPIGYLSEEHRNLRFESGKKLLKDYYKKHAEEKTKHLGLEKTFNLNFAGSKFTGKIDRIDELPDGGVEIIDYKTGSLKDQKSVDNDSQVTIYAIAAKRAFGLDPKLLSLYFVEAGQKISTTRTDAQFTKTENEVSEIVAEMKKGKFEASPGTHCAFCDYKNICPFSYNS
jgi:DNA helicase-2/ATP-dependent DNA helicase PcrA